VTHSGIVIEVLDLNHYTLARRVAEEACRNAGRAFAGVRPYARGSAFLRETTHG
jgi:hypothetical protein